MDARSGPAAEQHRRARARRLGQEFFRPADAACRGVEIVRVPQFGHVQFRGNGAQPPLVPGHVKARKSLRPREHGIDRPHDPAPFSRMKDASFIPFFYIIKYNCDILNHRF